MITVANWNQRVFGPRNIDSDISSINLVIKFIFLNLYFQIESKVAKKKPKTKSFSTPKGLAFKLNGFRLFADG